MIDYILTFKQNVLRIRERANERSYYPLLCTLFENFGMEERRKIEATPEETSPMKGVGLPDITVRENDHIVGWVELKLPENDLNDTKFANQFSKYKESLENILFVNLRQWQLYQWDKDRNPKKIADISFDVLNPKAEDQEGLKNILRQFFEGKTLEIKTSQQLASALAKKARLLSHQVRESLDESRPESELVKLKNTLQQTLIQDLSAHQFANMMAETLTYSLFLAALEHSTRSNRVLNLTTAVDYLPMHVPILSDLYSLVRKISKTLPNMYRSAELIIEQLNKTDIASIRNILIKHKPEEDPVIQFYEPFLAEYDPEERKRRGVYYTPKPIVDYIIRAVDDILKEKFNKPKGLDGKDVYLLDPATGTGTFLMSAMQQVYNGINKNAKLSGVVVKKEFNKIMAKHILKNFFGFEILVAPYVIAHLKLTLEAERLGFNFSFTKNDGDPDDDRFKVYLANTLDDPNKPSANLFGFDSIPKESEEARKVKEDVPILAIVGNPPYSNFGRMNRSEWILNLLKDYKRGLGERKINIDDDFIKFIRFAQWKLEQTGQGVFGMITSNTFIDGITHRQMRRALMDTFDEIYIYNLHGNSRKGESAPDGGKDENVFNIQQGVSINIFIKHPKKQSKTIVKYCDLWGSRKEKFATLMNKNFKQTKWQTLLPKEPNWFFAVKDTSKRKEYEEYISLTEVFINSGPGIKTERDYLAIHFNQQEINDVVEDFKSEPIEFLGNKYHTRDTRDWTLTRAKKDIKENQGRFIKLQYRPFDFRQSYFTGQSRGFMGTPGKIAREFVFSNLALITKRQINNLTWNYSFATHIFPEVAIMFSTPGNPLIFPLYLYPDLPQSSFISREKRIPNLSPDFIKTFSEKLGLKFIFDGRGDLKKTFGPEDVFYYAYAIFHSPTYRSRYAEQLKIDFPRLPLTDDKKLFSRLAALGNELVNLHLLGENPFDKSKTIFNKSKKWGVKIGGKRKGSGRDWDVSKVIYDNKNKRVYVNAEQYFEGVEKDVWEFKIGGYQVLDKWLKDRKKADRALSSDDIRQYMKIIVAIRETIRIMEAIDKVIPSWPIK